MYVCRFLRFKIVSTSFSVPVTSPTTQICILFLKKNYLKYKASPNDLFRLCLNSAIQQFCAVINCILHLPNLLFRKNVSALKKNNSKCMKLAVKFKTWRIQNHFLITGLIRKSFITRLCLGKFKTG